MSALGQQQPVIMLALEWLVTARSGHSRVASLCQILPPHHGARSNKYETTSVWRTTLELPVRQTVPI